MRYPGAVHDPDTGAWISDAEVAEIPYTAFTSTNDPVTARLVVRRVKDANQDDTLFPVWRYHPFFTNSTEPVADADITHRRHAIIETTFADLIDGPLAHIPSGRFGANSAWVLCAAITHNLLRAAGILAGDEYCARGSTLRRRNRPSWPGWLCSTPADPGSTYLLALVQTGLRHGRTRSGYSDDYPRSCIDCRKADRNPNRKSWADEQRQHVPTARQSRSPDPAPLARPVGGSYR